MQFAHHPLEHRVEVVIPVDSIDERPVSIVYALPVHPVESGVIVLLVYGSPDLFECLDALFGREGVG
jgi:hypothetical protein